MKKKSCFQWGLALLFALASFASFAATHYVGSYVGGGGGQDIFIRDCNKFRAEFTATCGSNTYYNDQYYYGYDYLFAANNDSYIDYEDLAFFSGHGNPYCFYPVNNGVCFNNVGDGWGDAWLKWVGFFTCLTIYTPADDANAYNAYNNVKKGVHVMCGFRTVSALADTPLPTLWARYMKQGNRVWYAWFRAVNECRGFYGSVYTKGYPGTASAVMFTDAYGNASLDPYYDTLFSYSNRPSANARTNFLYQY